MIVSPGSDLNTDSTHNASNRVLSASEHDPRPTNSLHHPSTDDKGSSYRPDG